MNERTPIPKNNAQKPTNNNQPSDGGQKKSSGNSKKAAKWAVLSILFIVLLLIVASTIVYYIIYDGLPFKERDESYVMPAYPSEGDFSIDFDVSTVDNATLDTPIYVEEPINEDIVNILLVGCDSADEGSSRSDTMMMMSYNKNTGKIVLSSFLRDSFVPIEDHNWNKLNASYSWGGVGLTINTINEVYDLDIQHYVSIDFSGFESVVESIGGVTITITDAEAKYLNRHFGSSVSAGEVKLNGTLALGYARIRKDIVAAESGDFNRTERQRKLIMSVINQALNSDSGEMLSLLGDCMQYVRTNLGAGTILSLSTDFLKMDNFDVTGYSIPADGTWSYDDYGGLSIVRVDFDKNIAFLREKIYGEN